jgi:hypothetical protein
VLLLSIIHNALLRQWIFNKSAGSRFRDDLNDASVYAATVITRLFNVALFKLWNNNVARGVRKKRKSAQERYACMCSSSRLSFTLMRDRTKDAHVKFILCAKRGDLVRFLHFYSNVCAGDEVPCS